MDATERTVFSPARDPNKLRDANGGPLAPPDGWAFLPAGDAGLTRRVKAAGPVWVVKFRHGRREMSLGLWAPADHVTAARAALETERADPGYARKREAAARRREREQAEYVGEFAAAVRRFLAFAAPFADLEARLADLVTAHATPVGSGTVARTERIPVAERAEAAVLAWMRHQTTDYDERRIARVKGERRRVRRELAGRSRRLLDAHRRPVPHAADGCDLCEAVADAGGRDAARAS